LARVFPQAPEAVPARPPPVIPHPHQYERWQTSGGARSSSSCWREHESRTIVDESREIEREGLPFNVVELLSFDSATDAVLAFVDARYSESI
jgi:hypothetical protein